VSGSLRLIGMPARIPASAGEKAAATLSASSGPLALPALNPLTSVLPGYFATALGFLGPCSGPRGSPLLLPPLVESTGQPRLSERVATADHRRCGWFQPLPLPGMEKRIGCPGRGNRADDHGLPLPAWHIELEQDRASAVLAHHPQLAGPPMGPVPGKRFPEVTVTHRHGTGWPCFAKVAARFRTEQGSVQTVTFSFPRKSPLQKRSVMQTTFAQFGG
jgi:hypothetical protein